jgi:transposase
MEVLVDRAAGADVHKKSVTVCILVTQGRSVTKEIRRFSTFHSGLLEMRSWLLEHRVTHVAMESTGEYWKPIYEVLEDDLRVIVANAQHVKNVPGRKTDPEDSAWLAKLLRHGLLTPSFVPGKEIRHLRDKSRSRRKLVQLITRIENRTQKILEGSGIKLGSVASDVFGATGRRILEQLAANRTDPAALARLAKGSLKNKIPELEQSLEGSFTAHHASLLERQLSLHQKLEEQLHEIDGDLWTTVQPYRALIDRLDRMPGINRVAAVEILGEIGTDMSAWRESKHIVAWSGLCPGNHESAGKRKNVAARKGNPFLKAILTQAATGAVRTAGTFYQAKFKKLVARRGYKRAIVAVAHSMLVAIYHMIKTGAEYQELGSVFNVEQDKQRRVRSLVTQLQKLGLTVSVHELPTSAAG